MTELERLLAFEKGYIELTKKYNLSIYWCCCANIADSNDDDLDNFRCRIDNAIIDNKTFTAIDGEWSERL